MRASSLGEDATPHCTRPALAVSREGLGFSLRSHLPLFTVLFLATSSRLHPSIIFCPQLKEVLKAVAFLPCTQGAYVLLNCNVFLLLICLVWI